MSAAIISFNAAAIRLYEREQLRQEQRLVELAEAEIDKSPSLSIEHLIVRSLHQVRRDKR